MSSARLASSIHLQSPDLPATKPAERTYIIYYITGNPGLIEYYSTFLTHLYGLLTRHTSSNPFETIDFHIFGRSLSGFEADSQHRPRKEKRDRPPFGLQEQISHSEAALEELVREVRNGGAKDIRVIMMGHSVGAYIMLEITRRLREKVEKKVDDGIRIVGGVCLFPTVAHIAHSPSGKKSSVRFRAKPVSNSACMTCTWNTVADYPQWLLKIPTFATMASLLAKTLTFLIPTSFLSLLIRTSMSFPPDAARVTAAFLHSPHGVHQAL